MKILKNLLCLAFAALVMTALCACDPADSVPSDPTQEMTQPSTNAPTLPEQWEDPAIEPTTSAPDFSEPATEKYECPVLLPYGATAQMKDRFLQFADDGQTLFRTKDGQLLYSEDPDRDHWFAGQSNVAKVVCVWNNAAYMDAKGFLYIRSGNKVFPCQNIRGQIVWYFVDMLSGDLCICSQDEEGYLYYNAIDPTGIKERYDNEPLSLYDFRTDTRYDRVDKIRFVQDDIQPNVYAEVDGMAFYSNVTGVDFLGGGPHIWIDSAYATKAENVLSYGYGGATSPLYKVDGDASAVYYRYGFSGTELPIFMPQGKTVDQLTQVIFGDTTLLIFDDGSVYTCRLVHTIVGPDVMLDEHLTRLNQSGAIRQIFQSTYLAGRNCQLRILMDDNVTYIYTPENG
jgi:hypothetical protein